jgi:hypothetical protein
MAHPSSSFPTKFVLINGAETVVADIFAIHVLATTTGTMAVKAAGIYEQLAQDDSDGNTHLANGDTPAAQQTNGVLNGEHAAGLYERLSTASTTLPCVIGNTIYGDFKSVTGVAGSQFICYLR